MCGGSSFLSFSIAFIIQISLRVVPRVIQPSNSPTGGIYNPIGRFKAAFSVQMVGFVGGVVMHTVLNGFINPSQNIGSTTKFIYGLLPLAVNVLIFFIIKQVYESTKFDEREFFRTD